MGARVFSVLSLSLAVGCILFAIYDYQQFYALTPGERLQTLWAKDLKRLRESQKLPPGWNSIQSVEYFTGTERARKWLSQMKPSIPQKSQGENRLEVFLLSWENGPQLGAIVQYNLIHLESGDTTWELSRNFLLQGVPSTEEVVLEKIQDLLSQRKTEPIKDPKNVSK